MNLVIKRLLIGNYIYFIMKLPNFGKKLDTKAILFIVVIFICLYFFFAPSESSIANVTDEWIKQVTIKHDPKAIGDMFCSDGNLVGTVSQVKRTGKDIESYFDYFAKLPGIKVVDKKYNISKVSHDVFLNTAFITWMWDGLDQPIIARMTFLFRGNCIFQLHSSALPDLNDDLLEVSGTT
jgi:hypothetical protein